MTAKRANSQAKHQPKDDALAQPHTNADERAESIVEPSQVESVAIQDTAQVTHQFTVDEADIDALVHGYHGAPFNILGPHHVEIDGEPMLAIRAFRSLDAAITVVAADSTSQWPMTQWHESGFFEAHLPTQVADFRYTLQVVDKGGTEFVLEDPYRFPPILTDYDLYLFGEGNFYYAYEKLGAHPMVIDGVPGVNFAVWAPNAQRVSLVGPFNGWDRRATPMRRHETSGIWELFFPHLPVGMHYKFAVHSRFMGYEVDKADPFGFYAEMRPSTDSRVWDITQYEWQDDEWLEARPVRQALDQPLNIYEVHLGSWRRVPETNGFLSYRDLAHQLVEYALQMGYTHLELLPITEHPYDGSWGYQTTGYFAPTSRFGSPDDFKYFVDYCHQHGIGVILDWVPAHFPRDAHGLAFFDGTHLFEHSDPRQGEHQDWGTKIFNFGRNEVRNFLISSALFWLKEYHLDGLRVDAVSSMLYLDFSREGGQWVPNRFGGRENLDAIDFIRRFNEVIHEAVPGILSIAEESTSWPMTTKPTYMGGLGFDHKWNMGWMHDMLSYMEKDPIYRRFSQNQITFSLMYAFHENFVLPFSHDEVVHLKRAMLDKMPGDVWQKFANLRALYAYMAGHPGKKLLFMGQEFGQWTEWNEARSLDWHLLEYGDHQQLQHYVADLNHLYLREPALHRIDNSWEGFQWIDISDAEQSIISFVRHSGQISGQKSRRTDENAQESKKDAHTKAGEDTGEHIVVICNFTPVPRYHYRVGLPSAGSYAEILNSDRPEYGGSGVGNPTPVTAENVSWQSCKYSAPFHLPPLGVIFLKVVL